MENHEVGKQEDMSLEEWVLHKCEETHDRAARIATVSSVLTSPSTVFKAIAGICSLKLPQPCEIGTIPFDR